MLRGPPRAAALLLVHLRDDLGGTLERLEEFRVAGDGGPPPGIGFLLEFAAWAASAADPSLDLRAAPAVSLSGGERRRVEIARALASEPAFMLLDEPFAGIDPLAIADIREVIGYLKGRGIGILITDHNVRETLDIIDRASIIHAGEVLFEGTPQQIIDDPEVRRVYLGERFGQTAAPVAPVKAPGLPRNPRSASRKAKTT
jgi:hypothetical protein